MSPAHARAAGGPVNVTLNIPADVRQNPCTSVPDLVNVSGTLHIIYYVRSDGSGGYHVNQTTDERAKGQSLTTSVKYLLSETYDTSWQASAGSTYTEKHDSELVSQAGTPNFLMQVQYHTTINAMGVPTAAIDKWRVSCAG